MLHPDTLYRVVCRPALPMDTRQVMELTSRIWEGEDYIPHVWADWLADEEGLLAVAEYGGRVVGLGKLSRIEPESWWMEGLRVHPDYEGQRIASRLHDYLLERWQKMGSGVIRLATGSHREPIHHLCERTGFRKVLELSSYIADPIPGAQGHFTRLDPQESGAALEFTLRSETLTASAGLVELDWRWSAPARRQLEAAGAWWWLNGDQPGGLLLARQDEHEGRSMLMIQLAACSLLDLPACLRDCRSLAAELGLERVAWFAPLRPEIEAALAAAGFQRDWDKALYIFEKLRL